MSAAEQTQHGEGTAAGDDVAAAVRALSDRMEALQADVRRLGGPGLPGVEPGWEDEPAAGPATPSYAWISSVPAPVRRRPAVPRLLLEVLFLAAAATAAAVARLDAAAIAGVMAGAWVLVALIEWAAARAERSRDAVPSFEPLPPAELEGADPAWFVPPVEHTLIEDGGDSPTAVTRLPPASTDAETTVERQPGE